MFKERLIMHEDAIPGGQKRAFETVCSVFSNVYYKMKMNGIYNNWSSKMTKSIFELVVNGDLYVYNATTGNGFGSDNQIVQTNYSQFPMILVNASVICANDKERYLIPINITLNPSRCRISRITLSYDASSITFLCFN